MRPEPQFRPFPLARAPLYARWWIAGAVLMALVGGSGVLLRPFVEPRLAALLGAGLLSVWLLLLLARTLYYRLNQHLAQAYREEVQRQQQRWWAWHGQQVGLAEAVLIGPMGSGFAQWRRVLAGKEEPPVPSQEGAGTALRLLQVFGGEAAERERQLAQLLVQAWRQQPPEEVTVKPLRCYWQGSPSAWEAFAGQLALDFPGVQLPAQPEPWQGLASISAIIDCLYGAAEDARVLCAGCQSTMAGTDAVRPAGEAAVLWLLGKEGEVRFSRGEWFSAGADEPAAVALRAQRQGGLEAAPEACVSFSPPEDLALDGLGWNLQQYRQDAYFGELHGLQAMVAQTLAACLAKQHAAPCAWLARDAEHDLAMGVVSVDETSS